VRPDVAAATAAGRAVVALSSTPFAHSLPWPVNLETARQAEAVIRQEGAVPAVLAVLQGRLTVGLDEAQLERLCRERDVLRASRRDLAAAVTQGRTAAATVAAALYLAHRAGIRLVATGAIGGASTGGDTTWDVSADLLELSRTPAAVVCGGARSMLDLPRTLEMLESFGVPVVGHGTDFFPAFYVRLSSRPVSARVDSPAEAATLLQAHWALDGAGVVLAQPAPEAVALEPDDFAHGLLELERRASTHDGRTRDPAGSLVERLSRLTKGRTLRAYQAIVVANARLAAQVARELAAAAATGEREA
jgi:pseudouridine-5'-phosphate glycosidase